MKLREGTEIEELALDQAGMKTIGGYRVKR